MAVLLVALYALSKPKAVNVLYQGQKPVLELTLSERARAALDSGVSLEILSRLASYKTVLFFGIRSASKQSRFVLQRHALSNRYLVKTGENITPKLFSSANEAMEYIANISMIQLDSFRYQHSKTAIRVNLNKFDLPSPMRLDAFISQGWKNDTGWVVWVFSTLPFSDV